ncbi:MAG: hypothetical protein AAFZ18_27215 [Myxococcota bacterium]
MYSRGLVVCSTVVLALTTFACSDDETTSASGDGGAPAADSGGSAASDVGASDTGASSGEDASAGGDGGQTADAGEGEDAGSTTDAGVRDAGGGGSSLLFCQEACTQDADCQVMSVGSASCVNQRCVLDSNPLNCTTNPECVAFFAGWTLVDTDGDFLPDAPCTADGPLPTASCLPGEVCCALGSVCVEGGRCALAPSEFVTCEALQQREVRVARVNGGPEVTVCAPAGAVDAVCDMGTCRNPCARNSDCLSPSQPVCDTATGDCHCAPGANDSCAANTVGGTVCQASGQCGCGQDSECTGPGFDTCYSGFCGCASVASCPAMTVFDGTRFVCEGVR